MKSPTDLFDLIKSLTPSEKGYFKKYVAKGEGKKYLKLFDAINAMEEYDEEKLKKKFKKELSNLSAAKNYLFEEVLEATRSFQLNNSFTSQILRLTDQADLLYKRGLYETASDKYAEAYEKAVAILSYKHAVLPRWGYIQCCFRIKNELLLPVSEMIALDNKILDETWLDFGHQQVAVMMEENNSKNGHPQTMKMLDERRAAEKAHNKLVEGKVNDSVVGRAFYHQREAFYAQLDQKYIRMLKHTLGAYQIFTQYPLLKITDTDNYLTMLLNLRACYTLIYMEQEKNFLYGYIKEEASRLKAYMSHPMQLEIESRLYNIAIVEHIRQNATQKTDKLFEEIVPWFNENKKRLQIVSAGRFMIWYMEHLFRKGDYRELLFRCNEFLYDKSMAYPQFHRANVLLICLTVYLEQGDWDILPAKLKESYRLLKEETITNEAVLLVVSLVGKVIKERKQFELKPTLQKLKEEMAERRIKKEFGNEVFSPFRFETWINSKLEGMPYKEVISRMMNGLKRRTPLETFEEELKAENLTPDDLRLPLIAESSLA